MPKPLRAILCAGRPATFSPSKTTSPAVGRSMPMIDLHRGRLAGAVRPDQAEDLAGAQIEAQVLDRGQAAEALGQAADFEDRGGRRSASITSAPRATGPLRGSRRGRTARRASATAETMKVASSPVGRRNSPATIRKIAPSAAPSTVRRPPSTAATITLHADRDVDHGADRGGAEIEHQQRARQARRRTR